MDSSETVAPESVAAVSIARGKAIFETRHCTRCHIAPEYTSPATYDVGLKNEFGFAKFNPPSLRGVGQHADELFHDNRTSRSATFRSISSISWMKTCPTAM